MKTSKQFNKGYDSYFSGERCYYKSERAISEWKKGLEYAKNKETNKMRNYLKNKLGVPENWDKYDYQTQRYSFEDIEEILETYKEEQLRIGSVMPSIGRTYSIIEKGKRIFGTVESHQGDTGKFWVKWNDGEITLESKIDNCR